MHLDRSERDMVETLVIDTIKPTDPSGIISKRYRNFFSSLSDEDFRKFMDGIKLREQGLHVPPPYMNDRNMNQFDKEFAAKLFNLSIEDVEVIFEECKRVDLPFAELVDDYKAWQQAQALQQPYIPHPPRKNIFQRIYVGIRNILRSIIHP